MNIILLIVFGGIVGWLASIITESRGGVLWDIILGIVGSLLGGWIMNAFGQPGVSGFNLYSFLVGILGAIVLVYIGRALQSATHNRV